MSIFNELLPSLFSISDNCTKNFNLDLKDALKSLDQFEEEFQSQNGRNKAREKTQKDKNAKITLQSIDEGEDEPKKRSNPTSEAPLKHTSKPQEAPAQPNSQQDLDSQSSDGRRGPKKRSKNEVDDMSSPEQDKRVKRNASVKAQSIISKQVNVNLSQKLRRENSSDKSEPARQSSRSRRHKDDEKENLAPNELAVVHIKQEKISLPSDPEPMEMETLILPTEIDVKVEKDKDDIAMPPPVAPVPKPRKAVPKEKPQEKPQDVTSDEDTSRRSRRTRNKPTDVAPVAAERATRAASRALPPEEPPAAEARPKRTRGRKKLSEVKTDSGNATQSSTESLPASPADKPRPKRTRRAQKADKEESKPVEPPTTVSLKEERQSGDQQISSPIIPFKETKPKNKKDKTTDASDKTKQSNSGKDLSNTINVDNSVASTTDVDKEVSKSTKTNKEKNAKANNKDVTNIEATGLIDKSSKHNIDLPNNKSNKDIKTTADIDAKTTDNKDAKTKDVKTKANGLIAKNAEKVVSSGSDIVDARLNETRVISKAAEMDETIVLPNGVYNHAPNTPKNVQMNETMVLEKTTVLEKPTQLLDCTVVLERAPLPANVTDDNSLMTDDSDPEDIPDTPTTPPRNVPETQPLSAVKEKVQQFEEMASRVTRTKTRAMAKKEEEQEETQTPPDKVSKAILSSETLAKMNNLIFNGKAPQTSSSACKPRVPVPVRPVTASASKATAINRARETAEEALKHEDPRQKKEALLEAKRELQKKKREEKMVAAALARSQAERERRALLEAAAREREQRQLQAGRERGRQLRDAERKKQELARKAAEAEERRRAEDAARQLRLEEEQRRAQELRDRRHEELELMKREEARMAKEVQMKQREYIEKQKKQNKMLTPFKTPHTPLGKYHAPLPAAYMEDGFQYLNSDEDADTPERPVPSWSTSKVRRLRLSLQARVRRSLVDAWFGVGARSPDLADIFPSIERARLKRTSSAVWHTPPPLPPVRD